LGQSFDSGRVFQRNDGQVILLLAPFRQRSLHQPVTGPLWILAKCIGDFFFSKGPI
jgi:hypothetical protein